MNEKVDRSPARGDFPHPYWCDPGSCGTPNPVPCHLSAPRRVSEDRPGGLVITGQLSSIIDELPDQAPVSVELVIRDPVTGSRGTYLLDRENTLRLHALLGDLAPTVG
jgi:hypothetical protein